MEKDLERFMEKIGYRFRNEDLLRQAFTHSSWANEHRDIHSGDNERLEFLGDAVLELASSDCLYNRYPSMPEGKLTRLRASLVCESTLAMSAREIGLTAYIRLGNGEERTGGRERDSIVSDAMEAVIGAVYLDGGFGEARRLVERTVLNDIEHKRLFSDSKTRLQEILQRDYPNDAIHYDEIGEDGPEHAKVFRADVRVGDTVLGTGEGQTKKAAQQQAAYRALLRIREKEPRTES